MGAYVIRRAGIHLWDMQQTSTNQHYRYLGFVGNRLRGMDIAYKMTLEGANHSRVSFSS